MMEAWRGLINLSVIKSDSMKRKLLLSLILLVLLSGCGQRREPEVEHFQLEVVATLQKPISQPISEFVNETPPPEIITPQPSPLTATESPMVMFTPTSEVLQPTDRPYGVETTPTANLTMTSVATLENAAWEGVWNIWYQTASGGYTPAVLNVQVNGTRLGGSAKIDGIDFSFKGEIFVEEAQVEGEWQTVSNSGTFWWRMNSADTFVGSRENRFGFCGNRATVQPNPCREVSEN